jgi:hypothetical protein
MKWIGRNCECENAMILHSLHSKEKRIGMDVVETLALQNTATIERTDFSRKVFFPDEIACCFS